MTSNPDQIRSDIERTQQNLSADVDALTQKVSPSRMVDRRVQQTRSAVTSVKERLIGTTTDAASTVSDTAGSAKDTLAATISSAGDMASSVPEQARQRTLGNPLWETLAYIDCHAVGALLSARKAARLAGGDVLLAAPHGAVERLLSLLGVRGVYVTVAAAVSAGRGGARRRAVSSARLGTGSWPPRWLRAYRLARMTSGRSAVVWGPSQGTPRRRDGVCQLRTSAPWLSGAGA